MIFVLLVAQMDLLQIFTLLVFHWLVKLTPLVELMLLCQATQKSYENNTALFTCFGESTKQKSYYCCVCRNYCNYEIVTWRFYLEPFKARHTQKCLVSMVTLIMGKHAADHADHDSKILKLLH